MHRCDVTHSQQGLELVIQNKNKGEKLIRVLLAIDGSPFAQEACRFVSSHFRIEGTEVLVLQVVEPLVFSSPPQMAKGYAPEMASRLQDQLKYANESVVAAVEALRKSGFKADSRVIEKETRAGILETAQDWKANLIVLGSHGEKSLRKFLLGSVAEHVARHAQCSALIVRT